MQSKLVKQIRMSKINNSQSLLQNKEIKCFTTVKLGIRVQAFIENIGQFTLLLPNAVLQQSIDTWKSSSFNELCFLIKKPASAGGSVSSNRGRSFMYFGRRCFGRRHTRCT